MKKMTTLFKKDPNDLGRVINEVDDQNKWVFASGIPTRKYDGTSCAIINKILYKRFNLKKGRSLPSGAIPCQPPDKITGHHPHWAMCVRSNPGDKWHFSAFDNMDIVEDGTYELCGPKVQGNPENFRYHVLVKHGDYVLKLPDFSFNRVKEYLESQDIEGIVFHDSKSDRMCKIRKSDFGLKR